MIAGLSSVRHSLSLLLLLVLLVQLFWLLLPGDALLVGMVKPVVAGEEILLAVLVLCRAVPPLRRLMLSCLEFRTLVRLLLLVRFTESSPVDVEDGKTADTPSLAPSHSFNLGCDSFLLLIEWNSLLLLSKQWPGEGLLWLDATEPPLLAAALITVESE